MNNAYVLPDGGYALEDKTKMASMLELKNNGRIELKATKEAGKQDWSMLLGMDATEDAVFAMGKFGVGVEKPDHAFQVAGGEAQLSLGNNLFLNGEGSTNVIAANAFIRKQQWVIQRKDRFATSIHLKDDGRVDMYGTAAQGSAEWRKMLGFNGPKHTVYAFGKMGINTENPTHTLTLPSGDHHISLGNNLFLNGAGTLTRIMGNSFMKLGKYTVANEHHHGLSIELNSAQSQIDFGGSQTKGSDNLLKLLSLNFVKKSVSLPSGSLGVKTTSPKVSLDVRGHMHLEDPSQAAVLYSPASGPGFFLRVSDNPGKYDKSQERYFFGSNSRVGFGTTSPEAVLHLVKSKNEASVPLLTAQTEAGDKFDLVGNKKGFAIQTRQQGWVSFESDEVKPLQMYHDAEEVSVNNVKVAKTMVLLAGTGGRVGIGESEPKSQHNLHVSGPGIILSEGGGSGGGVLAFANDAGGSGFQLDYSEGKMKFGSLPPTSHLKKESKEETYMTFTDSGLVGIGTESPDASLTVKSETGVKLENKEGASWSYNVAKDGALEFSSNNGGFFAIDSEGGFHLNKHKKSEYKFEVSGKGLRLAGDESGEAPILFAADMGGKGFRMDYNSEKMFFGHEDGKKWHMVMNDGGMVGIGTDSPTSGLHVKHDRGIAIEHGGDKLSRWNVHTSKDTSALAFSFMESPKVTFTHEGFVGIGTEKPKRLLHVEGDMWVAGKLHVDNWFAKKAKEAKAERSSGSTAVHELNEAQALLELDEHESGKADDSYGIVDGEGNPADYAKMMTLMHKVIQSHTKEIKELKARLAMLEKQPK